MNIEKNILKRRQKKQKKIIETDKFDEVVNFYEKVFQKRGNVYTKNRWIEFKLK